MREEFEAAALGRAMYPLLTSAVVPRPIAWVTSRSDAGVINVAPHSFFTVAGVAPPTLLFTSVGTKDSLRNIRATGEFVVNVVTRELADAANLTATPFPPEVSELAGVGAHAGLHTEASRSVAVPRLAESPVVFECRLAGLHDAGGDCTVVFGEVLHAAVRTEVLRSGQPAGRPQVDLRALRPVARLGGDDWAEVGEVFALRRIPLDEWNRLHGEGADPAVAARAARPERR